MSAPQPGSPGRVRSSNLVLNRDLLCQLSYRGMAHPTLQRILAKVDVTPEGCWRFPYSLTDGYGKVRHERRWLAAHRVVYELLVGPVPPGRQLDHLCHGWDDDCRAGNECPHRACVNPDHLEPVTSAENSARSRPNTTAANAYWANKTHCPSGHEYDVANTWRSKRGYRFCRVCARERMRAIRKRKASRREVTA